jgi:glucan phosphoethanolaminetransferase (alkaline phosphatase superfamily)
MKASSLNTQKSLREHVLVPLLLAMANITLGIAAYLIHQLYIVLFSNNQMLLQTYNLADDRVRQNSENTYLLWVTLFVVLLIAQLISLKFRHSIVSALVLLASIGIVGLWML